MPTKQPRQVLIPEDSPLFGEPGIGQALSHVYAAEEPLRLAQTLLKLLEALLPGVVVAALHDLGGQATGITSVLLESVEAGCLERPEEWPGLAAQTQGLSQLWARSLEATDLKVGLFLYGCAPLTSDQVLLAERLLNLSLVLTQRDLELARRQQDSLARIRSIVETAVDAIITIDERGTILSVNSATERLFGYQAGELQGRNVKLLMPSPYRDEHDGYLRRYMDTGVKRIIGIGRRVVGLRKDGSSFQAHLAVGEARVQGHRIFTGFIRDVSAFVEVQSELDRLESSLLEQARQQEHREAQAREEERRNLSRELHDSVSQALFGCVMGSHAALQLLDVNPAKARDSMEYVHSLAESGLAEMRSLIFELRPEALEHQGLMRTLAQRARLLAKRYELQVVLEVAEDEPEIDHQVRHAAYRITIEALHNLVKHAQARSFALRAQPMSEHLQLVIEDDGKGFETHLVEPGHYGLQSIRERVAALGGRVEIRTAPQQGTRIEVHLPLKVRGGDEPPDG